MCIGAAGSMAQHSASWMTHVHAPNRHQNRYRGAQDHVWQGWIGGDDVRGRQGRLRDRLPLSGTFSGRHLGPLEAHTVQCTVQCAASLLIGAEGALSE